MAQCQSQGKTNCSVWPSVANPSRHHSNIRLPPPPSLPEKHRVELGWSGDTYKTDVITQHARHRSGAKTYVHGLRFATPAAEDHPRQKQVLYEKWLHSVEREEGMIVTDRLRFKQAGPESSGVDAQQGSSRPGSRSGYGISTRRLKDMGMSTTPSRPSPDLPGHGKDAMYDYVWYCNRRAPLSSHLATGLVRKIVVSQQNALSPTKRVPDKPRGDSVPGL